MKTLLLATSTLVAFATGARAADLGAPRSPVAAAHVAPAFTWTGVYLGAQAGHAWGRSTGGAYFIANGATDVDRRLDPKGLFGGLHAGYNHQINGIVLGAEIDANIADIRGDTGPLFFPGGAIAPNNFGKSRLGWTASARARLGVAVDRVLPYLTGGVAMGGYNFTPTYANAGALPVSSTQVGWTLGAGVEYAIASNWTARAEYRYTDYGRKAYAVPGFAAEQTRVDLRTHQVQLGVSYLFSTGGGAIVARY
jgi:outer membrane immunogenic protein